MPTAPSFILDANVFIEAHRRYYGIDFCPGFWEVLSRNGPHRLISIDRVKDELLAGNDSLKEWVLNEIGQSHFAPTDKEEVIAIFAETMQRVQASTHYLAQAKAEYATVADGWIAAYAKTIGATVVTHEEYDANIRKRVKLPNVCHDLGVDTLDTFDLLRQLDARFVLSKTTA